MAKYDSLRKTGRNQAVIRMHKESPGLSLAEIGQQFGISRQMVSLIIRKYGNKAA